MKKRILALSYTFREGFYEVRVIKQSHRCDDFVPRGYYQNCSFSGPTSFLASNGISLKSIGAVEWREETKTMYVRGSRKIYDEAEVIVPRKYIDKIEFAVAEYNFKTNLYSDLPYEWDELFTIK